MNIKINPVYFTTKSFAYSGRYRKLLNYISRKSLSFSKYDSNLDESCIIKNFLADFFSDNQVNFSEKIVKFDPDNYRKSLKLCKKSKFSMFLLNNDFIFNYLTEDNKTELLNKLLIETIDAQLTLENYVKKFVKKTKNKSPFLADFIDRCKTINIKKTSYSFENITGIYKKLNASVGEWKKQIFLEQSFLDEKTKALFKAFFKKFELLANAFDLLSLRKFVNYKCFVVVSKFNTLSIGLVFEGSSIDKNLPPSYKDKYNKILMHSAISTGKTITSTLDSIPKAFSYLNMNKYFAITGKRLHIFDNTFLVNCKKDESLIDQMFYKENPAKKVVYLTFITQKNHNLNKYVDRGGQDFFEYVSLFVGLNRIYDEYSLIQYKTGKSKLNIINYLEGDSKRLYFNNDNLFVVSAINPSYQSAKLDKEIENKKNIVYLNPVSHFVRYYSLWIFNSISSACLFSGMTLLENRLLQNALTNLNRFFWRRFLIQHFNTEVNSSFLPLFYISKKNEFYKLVFDKLSVFDSEESSSILAKNSYNLISSETGSKIVSYSKILSLISVLYTLFGFGLISKVFVDGYRNSLCSVTGNEPPLSWQYLLRDILRTEKFWLMFVIMMIPVFIHMLASFVRHVVKYSITLYRCTTFFKISKKYLKIKIKSSKMFHS